MILSWLEKAFFAITLFVATGAVLPLILQDSSVGPDPDGSAAIRAIWTGIYLFAGLLFAVRWQEVRPLLARQKWLVALLLLAALSVLWSVAPATTGRRAIALVGTTMVGLLLAARLGVDGTLRLTGQALLAVAILSLFFVVALPHLGIATGVHEGAWQGAFNHKNQLGLRMALGGLTFFVLAREGGRRSWLWWIGFALALLLLYKSRSASALVVLSATIAAYGILRVARLDYRLLLAVIIFLGLFAAGTGYWLINNYEAVLAALGREPTLTGRTLLWVVVLGEIRDRPWLGYGYGGYWLGWQGPSSFVWQFVGWMPPSAHNGYLDVVLDLGIAGLVTAMVGIGGALAREVAGLRSARTPMQRWPVLFLLMYLVYNSVESILVRRNNLLWILCVAVAAGARAGAQPSAVADSRLSVPQPLDPEGSLRHATSTG